MSEPAQFQQVRDDPFVHWVVMIAAVVLGFVLASVHWLGLVAAGILIGLVTTSFKRGLMAALGFGFLVLAVWFLRLALGGSLGKVLATGQFLGIAILVGLCAPLLGSLVRGIVE